MCVCGGWGVGGWVMCVRVHVCVVVCVCLCVSLCVSMSVSLVVYSVCVCIICVYRSVSTTQTVWARTWRSHWTLAKLSRHQWHHWQMESGALTVTKDRGGRNREPVMSPWTGREVKPWENQWGSSCRLPQLIPAPIQPINTHYCNQTLTNVHLDTENLFWPGKKCCEEPISAH